MEDYVAINRAYWDARVEAHAVSDFYRMKEFMEGWCSLKEPELGYLGDVRGLKVLHLQCHFGQDTLSLARRGAEVTGVDFSEPAIRKAIALAEEMKLPAEFVCRDIASFRETLPSHGLYDRVMCTYGTLGWLPDLQSWAATVAASLKVGGFLALVDFHPVIWMFDNDIREITYPYFNFGPLYEELEGTYADRKSPIKASCVSWNHALSEIAQALLSNGMRIDAMNEWDYSPYPCFARQIEVEPGRFQIPGMEDKLPMLYGFKATKVYES